MSAWERVEPSIYLKGGVYKVTYRKPGDVHPTSKTGFTSLAQARLFLADTKVEATRAKLRVLDEYNTFEPPSRTPTVGEMCERYRASLSDPKPATIRAYEQNEARIRKATTQGLRRSWLLDKTKIGQLGPDQADQLKADLEALGYKGHTLKSALTYVLTVHHFAIKRKVIPPTQRFQMPTVKVPRKKLPFSDPSELGPLVAAVAPRYRVPVIVLAATGLRSGELLGLTAEKIPALALADGTWQVDETAPPIMTVDQQLYFTPKQGQAPRIITDKSEEGDIHEVPCPHELTALIAGHLNTYSLGAVVDGHQLLWSTQGRHNLMYYSLLHEQISGAGRAIGKAVAPHDLRRLYASSAFAYGAGLPVVQGLLRHAMAETTLRYGKGYSQQVSEQGLAISRGMLRLVSGD